MEYLEKDRRHLTQLNISVSQQKQYIMATKLSCYSGALICFCYHGILCFISILNQSLYYFKISLIKNTLKITIPRASYF